jgi:hypothetical protein
MIDRVIFAFLQIEYVVLMHAGLSVSIISRLLLFSCLVACGERDQARAALAAAEKSDKSHGPKTDIIMRAQVDSLLRSKTQLQAERQQVIVQAAAAERQHLAVIQQLQGELNATSERAAKFQALEHTHAQLAEEHEGLICDYSSLSASWNKLSEKLQVAVTARELADRSLQSEREAHQALAAEHSKLLQSFFGGDHPELAERGSKGSLMAPLPKSVAESKAEAEISVCVMEDYAKEVDSLTASNMLQTVLVQAQATVLEAQDQARVASDQAEALRAQLATAAELAQQELEQARASYQSAVNEQQQGANSTT